MTITGSKSSRGVAGGLCTRREANIPMARLHGCLQLLTESNFTVPSKHSLIIHLDFVMQRNHSSLGIRFGNTCVNKALDRGARKVNRWGERRGTRGRCGPWRLSQLGVSDWYVLSAPR